MTAGFVGSNQRNGVFIEVDPSRSGVGGELVYPALMLGQKLAAGSATAGAPVLVGTAADAGTLFGMGSQLHSMVAAFRANNPDGQLYCLPVADPSGDPATALIRVDTVAGAAGTLYLYVGGRRYEIVLAAADTKITTAAAIVAAITADTAAEVTAVTDGVDTVTLTAKHEGTCGNLILIGANYGRGLGTEPMPGGLILVTLGDEIHTAPQYMSGGTGTASYTAALTAVDAENYDHIIWPGATNPSSVLSSYMNTTTGRWAWTRNQGGHVYMGVIDSVAQVGTILPDKEWLTLVALPGSWSTSYALAAAYAGAAARSLDVYAARPLHDLPIEGIMVPLTADAVTASQVETLIGYGATAISSSYRRQTLTTRNGITTSTTLNGSSSRVWQPTTRRYILMRLHRSLYQTLSTTFSRHVIGPDGTRVAPGTPLCTPSDVRGACIAWYGGQVYAGLVANVKRFAELLTVEIDGTNPQRINVELPPQLVNELTQIAVNDSFRVV